MYDAQFQVVAVLIDSYLIPIVNLTWEKLADPKLPEEAKLGGRRHYRRCFR